MDAADQARFDKLLETMTQAMHLHGLRDKTIDSYRRKLCRIAGHFRSCPDDLRPEELKEYFAALLEPYSWSTIKVDLSSLQFFHRYVLEREMEWIKIIRPPRVRTVYLGRYLYRGVLPEKDILSDRDGLITFRIRDNSGAVLVQSLPGADFLWMLLRHVLPKRFRRARDYGLLHGNCQKLLQTVQLLLHVVLPEPWKPQPKPPIRCPHCGGVMAIIAVRVREINPAPA